MKIPKLFLYRLSQTNAGHYCLLTRDCESLALFFGEPFHNFGSVVSDTEHSAVAVAMACGFEPGVKVEVVDRWQQIARIRENLAELYPGASDVRLREMGFGNDIDECDAVKSAIAA